MHFDFRLGVKCQQPAIQRLEYCIDEIRDWMVKHKLKLNDDKTEFIMISPAHNKKELNGVKIKIGEDTVIAPNNVRNLGSNFRLWF